MGFSIRKKAETLKQNAKTGGGLSPIAVDFGVGSLKVLQVSRQGKPELTAAACIPTPDELIADPLARLGFQCQALAKLASAGPFKGKRAVCAIPSFACTCKHLQFQAPEGTSLASVVAGAAPARLEMDPANTVVRHVPVPGAKTGSPGQHEVICFATRRDVVMRLMNAIRGARLKPVGMQTEHIALLRAFESLDEGRADPPVTLYVDLGASNTNIVVAAGQQMCFAKTADFGGLSFDRRLADARQCSIEQARKARLAMTSFASGRPSGGTGLPALDAQSGTATADPDAGPLPEMLDALADDISMCVRYYASLFPTGRIERALFVGGESRHVAMCQHIARALRVPAQAADPTSMLERTRQSVAIGVDLSAPQPGWAVPVGLCLCPTDL